MTAPSRRRRASTPSPEPSSPPAKRSKPAASAPAKAKTKAKAGTAKASSTAPRPARSPDPDDGDALIHRLLTAAVEETARLLEVDGAMVYLVDPATGHLKFAHDAGIKRARTREWIRTIDLAPGVGMFGRAVADRAVVMTRDYRQDASFRHASRTDRVVEDLGIMSMVVAPLVAGDEVFGALGAFSRRIDAFDAAQIALVRSLAEHAASAMANARLIGELDRSRQELDRSRGDLQLRAEAEQALREIAARITALRDPAEILQEVVELASRLVGGEGAILDLLDPPTGLLRWAYDDGLGRLFSDEERAKLWISVGEGATGVAVAEDRVVVAGDDLPSLFPPGPENSEFYRAHRLPLDDRGTDHRRAWTARRDRGLRGPARRIRRRRRDAHPSADRPGRDRDHQCPPHHRARRLAVGPRADRRGGADAARDRCARQRDARQGRDPAGRRRRGDPAAPVGRRDDRSHRPGPGLGWGVPPYR